MTAFQTISYPLSEGITAALQSLLNRGGWLWMTGGFITLPNGFVLLAIGLMQEPIIARLQGIAIIVGLLLLINPDIEIISSTGAILRCIGFIPIGMREISGDLG